MTAGGHGFDGVERRGLMFVLSSPSGAGKTTLSRLLIERMPGLKMSVSATTRPMRPGEVDGRDYLFVGKPQFESMAARDELLEWATVFDNRYGTPRLPVEGADGTHFIDSADVRSVRADAHYTKVHDGTRERMCPWSISEAEAQLDPGLFVRVHRSHIVAIPHVSFVRKEGDGAVIELDGPSPHRVPVSRAKIAEVKARLGLARRHA